MKKIVKSPAEVFSFFALALIAIFFSLQDVVSPLSENINYSDSSIYQYIGHLLTVGKMPYVDAFDHKGPILYLINAIACLINEKGGIWIVDAAFMILMFAAAFYTVKRLLPAGYSFAVTTIVMSGIANFYWIGNTPDFFSSVFSMVAVYILSGYFIEQSLNGKKIICIGVLSSLGFWLKPNTIGVIGVFCVAVLADSAIRKDFRLIRKCIAFFMIGFMIPTVAILIWMYANGALNKMIEDYFLFNFSYADSDVSLEARLSAFEYFTSDVTIAISILSAVGSLFILPRYHYEDKKTLCSLEAAAFSALILQAIVCAMAGRQYQQYATVLLSPCLILVGVTAYILWKTQTENGFQAFLLLFVMTCLVLVPNSKQSLENRKIFSHKDESTSKVVEYVSSNVGEDDLIAVASPDHCGIYLWSGRESATNYPYVQAGMYGNEELWNEYLGQIKESHPSAIIWNNNWPAQLLGDALNDYTLISDVNEHLYIFIRNEISQNVNEPTI